MLPRCSDEEISRDVPQVLLHPGCSKGLRVHCSLLGEGDKRPGSHCPCGPEGAIAVHACVYLSVLLSWLTGLLCGIFTEYISGSIQMYPGSVL